MARLPLEGIRILDFGTNWAGPQCSKLFGDMGAEVIKIVGPRRHDNTMGLIKPHPTYWEAAWPAYAAGDCMAEQPWNRTGANLLLNRNKLGITIDMRRPRGREIFKRLVKISDVVIENYSPKAFKNWELEYEVLKEINPGIIMVRMPAYGITGPEKMYKAHGLLQCLQGGVAWLTGYPDPLTPVVPGFDWGDPVGAFAAASATLVAIHYRKRTGKGQWLDVSQREGMICQVGEVVMEYTMNQRNPERMGNRHTSAAPYGVYPAQGEEKWVTIAVRTDEEWKAFCNALGNPEWAKDEKFSDSLSRWQNQDELDEHISQWTSQRDGYEIMHLLQKVGVPAAPVLREEDHYDDPQLKERRFMEELDHPLVGRYPYPGPHCKLSKTPGSLRMHAPLFGEHNEYVLGELLGMSKEELAELEREEYISTKPLPGADGLPVPKKE